MYLFRIQKKTLGSSFEFFALILERKKIIIERSEDGVYVMNKNYRR